MICRHRLGLPDRRSVPRAVNDWCCRVVTFSPCCPPQQMPTARGMTGSGVVGGLFYVFGGLGSGELSTNEVYDPATSSWSTGPNMVRPPWYSLFSALMELNETWTACLLAQPIGRWSPTAQGIGTSLYVCGGYYKVGLTDTMDIFDTGTSTWSAGPPMVCVFSCRSSPPCAQ